MGTVMTLASIPAILALVQLAKSLGVKGKWNTLLAVVLGIVGPKTINALEQHYGFTPDGRLDGPSNTVRAMQRALNEGRF